MLAPQDDVVYLIQLAQAGNQAAFAYLVQIHEVEICGYLTSLLGDRNDAQDCAQEAFFKAWKKISSLKDEGRFRPWLYTIARNTARDYQRRRGAFPQSQECLERTIFAHSSTECEEQAIHRELISLALARLPAKLGDCLRLDAWGFSRREIAQILGIGITSVGTYLSVARKQFRRAYYDLQNEK